MRSFKLARAVLRQLDKARFRVVIEEMRGNVAMSAVAVRGDRPLRTQARRQRGVLKAWGVALAAVVVLGVLQASIAVDAKAAAELDVATTHSPATVPTVKGSLPIGGKGQIRVLVRNVGDASTTFTDGTAGGITVVATLPAHLRATGVGGASVFGLQLYECAISTDGRTVTCQGPSFPGTPNRSPFALGPGQDACEAASAQVCPLVIEVQVEAGAQEGVVSAEIEACGGGAACAATSEPIPVHQPRPLGADYGAAPINGHPGAIQNAPAIPGPYAFWAGACDRSP